MCGVFSGTENQVLRFNFPFHKTVGPYWNVLPIFDFLYLRRRPVSYFLSSQIKWTIRPHSPST